MEEGCKVFFLAFRDVRSVLVPFAHQADEAFPTKCEQNFYANKSRSRISILSSKVLIGS